MSSGCSLGLGIGVWGLAAGGPSVAREERSGDRTHEESRERSEPASPQPRERGERGESAPADDEVNSVYQYLIGMDGATT